MVYLRDSQNSPGDFLYLRTRNRCAVGLGVGRSAPSAWCQGEEVVGWSQKALSGLSPWHVHRLPHKVSDTAVEGIKPKPHTPEQWWLEFSEYAVWTLLPTEVSQTLYIHLWLYLVQGWGGHYTPLPSLCCAWNPLSV